MKFRLECESLDGRDLPSVTTPVPEQTTVDHVAPPEGWAREATADEQAALDRLDSTAQLLHQMIAASEKKIADLTAQRDKAANTAVSLALLVLEKQKFLADNPDLEKTNPVEYKRLTEELSTLRAALEIANDQRSALDKQIADEKVNLARLQAKLAEVRNVQRTIEANIESGGHEMLPSEDVFDLNKLNGYPLN